MGVYNSSLTRVRPFFKQLVARDPSGSTWLPNLLGLADKPGVLVGTDLLSNPGVLQRTDLDKEQKLLPTETFLRWLIQHPEKMRWPKNGRKRYSKETQLWREKLMGCRDISAEPIERQEAIRKTDHEEAQRRALTEFTACGPAKCHNKWWAFEGQTAVDCYLATDRMRIYIEGKRRDVLSPSIDWYPRRNQLMRNLECASAHAAGMPFVCIIIAEQKLPAISDAVVEDSLPHLSETQRHVLIRHFLGTITWRDACHATCVSYEALPNEA